MFSLLWYYQYRILLALVASFLFCLLSFTTFAEASLEITSHAHLDKQNKQDKPVVRIAILSFRHKAVTLERWQPLIDYLNTEIPNVHFKSYAFTNREMDEAVAQGLVDFVFVQPSHYVVLTHTHGLSSPLATLVNAQDGQAVSMFGGVIFTRSDRYDVKKFSDLRGKTIATADISGLGGFQMQAFELVKHGLRPFKHYKVLETDQPQDRVVEAVASGLADAGFVRTGLLEAMTLSGEIEAGTMKILEPRIEQDFPFPTSTSLYPEWPFTAMTHVDRDLARKVASSLLSIPHDGELAQEIRISGFTIPGDYRSIDHLLRELRLPPFDTTIDFTFSEVWQRWQAIWLTLIGFISSILFLSVIVLMARNRKLVTAQRQLADSSIEIARLGLAVEQSPASIIITDLTGKIIYVNKAFEKSTGYRANEILGLNPRTFKSSRTPAHTYTEMWSALSSGQVWKGELINSKRDGSEFCESVIISPVKNEQGQVFGYLAVKQDITEQKENEARIFRLAFFDSLTGLANRTRLNELLIDRVQNPVLADHTDALLLVNIDRFKMINDARGQHLGDALLVALGTHLEKQVGETGSVARMGADEFAILLPQAGQSEMQTTQAAIQFSESLFDSLAMPLSIENESIKITLSVGVASFPDPTDSSVVDLLKRAGTALHRAKDGGGNQVAVFETHMGIAIAHHFKIEAELRTAIEKQQLKLFLQPQTLPDDRLFGAEVLVRWQHPDEGLISPGRFIPIAEESDLIVELSEYIFREACFLLARMQSLNVNVRLSINLSPRHFRKHNFITWFKALLIETGADAHYLTLEITEGLFIDNLIETSARMNELCTLGIHFSIDDFGTGYSSLAYLKRLPIKELKIDRAFVQDAPSHPDDAALVDAILAVAQMMKLEVVAEGVETPEQAEFMNARGRIIRQGYLFGRPEPADVWINRWSKEI